MITRALVLSTVMWCCKHTILTTFNCTDSKALVHYFVSFLLYWPDLCAFSGGGESSIHWWTSHNNERTATEVQIPSSLVPWDLTTLVESAGTWGCQALLTWRYWLAPGLFGCMRGGTESLIGHQTHGHDLTLARPLPNSRPGSGEMGTWLWNSTGLAGRSILCWVRIILKLHYPQHRERSKPPGRK